MNNNSSIKDVARRAGVSTATVSHVINDTRKVTEETHRKVMQAIEGLNYTPNQVARNLRTKSNNNIVFIIDYSICSFYENIILKILDFKNTFEKFRNTDSNIIFYNDIKEIDIEVLSLQNGDVFVITNFFEKEIISIKKNVYFINLSTEKFSTSKNVINIGKIFIEEILFKINSNKYDKIILSYEQGSLLKEFITQSNMDKMIFIQSEISSGFLEIQKLFSNNEVNRILVCDYNIALGLIKFFVQNENKIYTSNNTVSLFLINNKIETFAIPITIKQFKFLPKLKEEIEKERF